MRATPRLALAALVVTLVVVTFAVAAATAGAAGGSFAWQKALDPTPKGDGLYLCARGPAATVYACGSAGWESGVADHIWLVKYRAGGAQAWSTIWSGPDGLNDEVAALAVDGKGNMYVAGRTKRTLNHWDIVVLKYDAGGNLKWQVVYAADAVGTSEAAGIGVDGGGDVYIAGSAVRSGHFDLFTARFDGDDGTRRWTCWYDSAAEVDPTAMTITGAGDCYVAGASTVAGDDSDAILVKVTSAGAVSWSKLWGDPQDKDDRWATVTPMGGGGVVVAGSTGDYGSEDAIVGSYGSSGKRRWMHTWSSSGTADDEGVDAAVAGDGSTWVAVATDRGAAGGRATLVKWTTKGKKRFARTLGSAARPALVRALVLDGSGDAYLAGALASAAGGYDLLAAGYSAGGKLRWTSTAAYAGAAKDVLNDLVLGGSGYLYACGTLASDVADSQAVLAKIRR